ncbi:MAG: sulfatase, partial [Planctomycetaceae bacterium]|nr:sulfatase [Planctomycetaceae bacterium]
MPRWLLLLTLSFVSACLLFVDYSLAADATATRPNILWITCEDTSPDFGCYGDAYAVTPNVDRLAAQGARYNLCFSHAPVCAPSRSGLILGMYPTTNGSHHMRSQVPPRADWRTYSAYLRDAGYYCTNNSKTDYNFPVPKDAWDENGPKAHFRNRPNKSQPFFAIFNDTVSHESQSRPTDEQYQKNTRRLTAAQRHDPAQAKLPAYLPDTPVVRKNWAICYDNVTAMDYHVGDILAELEADGLADNTVVFFYGDHGRGLTRGKRWLYDSGTRVPLVIRWPAKIKPASVVDDLVAFVDLGPTVLSIAGIKPPANMQGQAFLGQHQAEKPRDYVYGARDRMDER